MFPQSDVSCAQMHYLRGEFAAARAYADRAVQGLDRGSPEWFLAEDILAASDAAIGD